MILNETEVRVVGSLIEKQITTPEYYPLTMNALMHACNQTSNRHPVISFDEKTTARTLETLRDKKLVHVVFGSDSRVPKYKQVLTETLALSTPEVAVLCVLMLRGPQTVGEIRGRTTRLHDFAELTEVEAALRELTTRAPALITLLPRQAGQKESRYAHLLAGDVRLAEQPPEVRLEPAMREVRAENERYAGLEARIDSLEAELAELRRHLEEFKKQFD